MSVYFNNIIGNEKLKNMLKLYIQNKKIPHAFIIEGQNGSGKKTICKSITAALSCIEKDKTQYLPCMKCINCEKIFKGTSPDVITVNTNGKPTIGVETIRELKNHTYLSSNELEYKAYIIDGADKMTIASQNSFLKILEEPVTNVLYFLLCENAGVLLPTIISRAPIIRTSPVSKKQLISYLSGLDISIEKKEINKIATLSKGNIGKAIIYALSSEQYTSLNELRDKVYNFLDLFIENTKKHVFLTFIAELDDKGNYCIDFLNMLYSAMRDIVLFKNVTTEDFDFFIDSADISRYTKSIKNKYASKLCILIENTTEQLRQNQGASSTNSIMQNFLIKTWGTYTL